MRTRAVRTLIAALVVVLAGWLGAGTAQADVTVGDDVNYSGPTNRGTCNGPASGCVVVPASVPNTSILTSPCEGTVTRFRINGVPTNNRYRLRVLQLAGTTATAVSASPAVALMSDGVNTFNTSLPIHAGNQVGLEFTIGTDFQSVRYRSPAMTLAYLGGIPDSGSSSSATSDTIDQWLFNADVACTVPAPPKRCKKKGKKNRAVAAKKKHCKKKKKKKK
jgi:hypothetical protein